jgi:uncharacterized protein YjbI with pentapeptide repeats
MKKFRSWWEQIKQHRVAIEVVAVVCVAVIVIIIIGYQFDWTGFKGKTVWDWLQLLGVLAIPVVVGFGAAWFTTQQAEESEANRAQQEKESEANREKRHQTELEIAEKNREKRHQTDLQIVADNQHEAAFRSYLDKMSELLIEEKLDESTSNNKVRKIARVETLAVLLGLDPIRKANVLLFLYESGLINKDTSIIGLKGADLSGANLSGASLSRASLGEADLRKANLSSASLLEANLTSTNLSGADLSGADLFGADLSGATLFEATLFGANLHRAKLKGMKTNLSGADLRKANLSSANLLEATLFGANLSEADLSYADLGGAKVTEEQLKEAKSLKGATMPDGKINE